MQLLIKNVKKMDRQPERILVTMVVQITVDNCDLGVRREDITIC